MKSEQTLIIEVLKLSKEKATALFAQNINFDYVEQSLKRHFLFPAFYYTAKQLALLERVPFRGSLEDAFYHNFSRNAKLEKVYCDIFCRARAQAIEVLPLKGINLTTFIYPHPGMRVMADIDVYCCKKEYPRLKELLFANDFFCNEKSDAVDAISHVFYKKETLSEPNIAIEVHTKIVPPRPCEVVFDLFERHQERKGIWYLSNEDLFITLLLKIRRDARNLNLVYFYDLFLVLKKGPINWSYIESVCVRNKIARVLYFALYYIEVIFGERFCEVPRAYFLHFFSAKDIFQWNARKGFLLRLCFFNSFKEFCEYLVKKFFK